MTGHWKHVPHTHTRPPIFSGIFAPLGTVWACDCGLTYTRVRNEMGETCWATPSEIDRISMSGLSELDRALMDMRRVANRHRRELGLRTVPA